MINIANWLGYGKCIYQPRLILGNKDIGLEPSRIKEKIYLYQKEIRFIWEVTNDNIIPFILKAKKARSFCEYMQT